jgi:hypothetical protein
VVYRIKGVTVTSDQEAERMARAARRLREALHPRTDVEDFDLQILSQALRVELIESLAGMAERPRVSS